MNFPLRLRHKSDLLLSRDSNGVLRVKADNEEDLLYGQGYAQALDRGMQMILTRILGQGRACELLEDSDELLQFDLFFRRLNWTKGATEQINKLKPNVLRLLQSFCDGINDRFQEKRPWELKLIKCPPEPWKISDILLLSRMIAYLTLQQGQGELERFIVEMTQGGIDRERLEELFPGKLEGLDIELLSRVKLKERIVPPRIPWFNALPGMLSSNNWVVSGKKSDSGGAMFANDIHLEVNRLPNIFQETILLLQDRYLMGGTVPGIPFQLSGRTNDLSWGPTYSFMDSVDFWVEKCKGGKFQRTHGASKEWVRFRERREIIKRKNHSPMEAVFFENEHGILDGNPYQEGYYLAERWSGSPDAGGRSLNRLYELLHAPSVKVGMEIFADVEFSFNWTLADREGNIGYQMSGLLPRRRAGVSGLVPLPGWDDRNAWKGFAAGSSLPRRYNPQEGFLVTANNDLNSLGRSKPITVSQGSYRAERITKLLKEKKKLNRQDMAAIQGDLYSLQAEKFMKILRPMIPDTSEGKILLEWDLRYDVNSKGAFLFERFYRLLFREAFGELSMGADVIDHLFAETGLFVDFYSSFDAVLFSKESAWFQGRTRDEIFKRALDLTLERGATKWGSRNQIVLKNIFWNGRLPRILGFDRGPVMLGGGRATPKQAQIYRSGGRQTSFAPAYRVIADMSEDGMYTNLLGGPSDRRFSRWYKSEVNAWAAVKHKFLEPRGEAFHPVASSGDDA